MSLREQLQGIYDQHGRLTPEIVVEEARDEAHPLHARFEWDDSLAGEAYRREQARHFIKSVKVTYAAPTASNARRTIEVRAWHAISEIGESGVGHTFYPVEAISQDAALVAQVEAEMKADISRLRAKYRAHHELFESVLQREAVA